MKTEYSLLSKQLVAMAESSLNYSEMKNEIEGLLAAYTESDKYTDSEKQSLNEISDPFLALLSRLHKEEEQAERKRQSQLVKTVMNTLSYTELEIVVRIFDILDGNEGVMVAGKAADGLGVTRSVVVSALRKLESARIIETRSLGVKGTYIKILNPLWAGEMRKLKV